LFLILSHNIIKKHFLRVAVKKPTATIQIFYLEWGCQGVLARLLAGRHSAARCAPPCLSPPACGQGQTGLTEK